jgi:hypothetical protein
MGFITHYLCSLLPITNFTFMNYFKLRLEADALILALRKQGYQCRKQHRQMAFKLLKEGQGAYLLAYIPDPVASWNVLPNDGPTYTELTRLVKSTLDATMFFLQPQIKEDHSRPWTIIRLLPNAQRYTVARFFNRQDAQDHRNFLVRYMPASEFEIVFDPAPATYESASL